MEVSKIKDIVRDNFKRIRKTLHITQEQLADFLCVEQSSVSKFESGDRNLSLVQIEKACALFGVSFTDLSLDHQKIKVLSPAFRKSEMSNDSL